MIPSSKALNTISLILKLDDAEETYVPELVGHTRESGAESRWRHLGQMNGNLSDSYLVQHSNEKIKSTHNSPCTLNAEL